MKKTNTRSKSDKQLKQRTNVSLSPAMMAAATFLGEKLFGNRTAYIEFALLQDMRSQGLTIDKIIELADSDAAKQTK